MRHGVFLGPWHDLNEDPTRALRRDLHLMEWLDDLGFDEAWIGEHHSGGWEIISSPELFIAAAAERTQRIRFGTGVISLPYHNPLMVANRIIQLDHQTMGRTMFGFGPGLLPSDALMMGIAPEATRERLAEALDVIIRLVAGETVTETTDWYRLEEARTHLLPFSSPRPEIAVASVFTPSGGVLAGKYGLSMLCVAASQVRAYDALDSNWAVAVHAAAESGQTVTRDALRLVAPVYIAETREKAREDVRFGLERYVDYANRIGQVFDIPQGTDPVDFLVDSGFAVIGTPDDAIELIERLLAKQGEFGCFMSQAFNWADFAQTKRSYELYARYVMPHFSGANASRRTSFEWCDVNAGELAGRRTKAVQLTIDKHEAESTADRAATPS